MFRERILRPEALGFPYKCLNLLFVNKSLTLMSVLHKAVPRLARSPAAAASLTASSQDSPNTLGDPPNNPPATDSACRNRHCFLPQFIYRFGAGIVQDIRARMPWYLSDWTDAWNYRVVPATTLIFFAKYGLFSYNASARHLTHRVAFCLGLHFPSI